MNKIEAKLFFLEKGEGFGKCILLHDLVLLAHPLVPDFYADCARGALRFALFGLIQVHFVRDRHDFVVLNVCTGEALSDSRHQQVFPEVIAV